MNAFKEGLQREPAIPNGSPSRRPIMGAGQIPTEAGNFSPEGADGHRGRRLGRRAGPSRQASQVQSPREQDAPVRNARRHAPATRAPPAGTTNESSRIRQSTLCNCRCSMRHPLLSIDDNLQPTNDADTSPHAPTLDRASWWRPKRASPIPAAPRERLPALPRRG